MDFFEVVRRRHSVRRYTDKAISQEDMNAIITVAESAPSSKNTHSSAFLIIEDPDTLLALSQMRQSGSGPLKHAKAAIVVMGDQTRTDLWVDNCAISATMIQLAATALGIGSCWIHVNGRKRTNDPDDTALAEDYVRELLGIRDQMRVNCIMALGYEAEPEA